jgi:tyrosinase
MATVRRRSSALTSAQRQRYINGINALIASGTYGQLVAEHADMSHKQHDDMGMGLDPVGRQRFLPWHRVFLLRLEQALQAIDPLTVIPYWRWNVNRAVPGWLAGFTPTVNVPGNGIVNVTRTPQSPILLPTTAQVNTLLNAPNLSYTQFTSLLDNVFHDTVHGWVGGTMNSIMISPADPLFWLHHAQVDRLWSIWQAKPANAGKNPTLAPPKNVMDPWTETEQQVRSIAALGYSYGPPAGA